MGNRIEELEALMDKMQAELRAMKGEATVPHGRVPRVKKTHRKWTQGQKLQILKEAEAAKEQGESWTPVCFKYHITPTYLLNWRKQLRHSL